MRYLGIASLLTCLSLPLASRADENLTIQLPPAHPSMQATGESAASPAASATPAAEKTEAQRFAEASRKVAAKTRGRSFASRGGFPAGRPGASTTAEKVVGRLGMVQSVVAIKASRGGSRTLAKVKPGTYIAINSEAGAYYGVLMSDKTTGWIPKDEVQILNYEVVTPKDYNPEPFAGYASNGGNAVLTGGQKSLLDYAYTFLGVPYKWGGTSPNGLDCSAFVQRCFSQLGISLPRTAHEQIGVGAVVSPEDLRAGDRLYFGSKDGRITHTGIYVGNGYFIHASSSRGGVAVSNLSEDLYRRIYAGARR